MVAISNSNADNYSNPRASNKRMVKRVALIVAGWTLLLLGVVGIFLPVLPGALFLLVGLSILSVEYEWARRWVTALRNRFPRADRKLQGILTRFGNAPSN